MLTFQNNKVDDEDLYDLLLHKIAHEDNVKDLVQLANLGCPLSPWGDNDVSALRLAIDLDRTKTTTALLALGADVFFRVGGYNILQFTWKSSEATVFPKMVITRVNDRFVFFH